MVLCDVDPALARARRKAAKLAAADQRPPARKGLAGVGLQHRLRRGYLDLAAACPERWAVVDNDGRLEETVALVTELVADTQRVGARRSLVRFHADAEVRRARRPARLPETPADALEVFLERVDAYAEHEPRVAAHLLGGLAGPAVDERRRALAVRVPGAVLVGLTGQDDAASWSLRRALQPEHTRAVAATLLGLPSGNLRAEALRLALEDVAPTEVAMSLESVDGPEATAMRARLFERAPDAVMASLARLASAEAWSLRARWLTRRHGMLADSYPVALAAALSVTGLDDDRAWSLREQAQPTAPVAALASLEGVVTPVAWQWRETHLARAPKVVMATLTGVRHARAWPMRNAVAVDCKEALDSIMGLDEPEAWAMREMHADDWPSTTVKSLGSAGPGGARRGVDRAPAQAAQRQPVAAQTRRGRGAASATAGTRSRGLNEQQEDPMSTSGRTPKRSKARLSAIAIAVAAAAIGCGDMDPGATVNPGCLAAAGAMLPWKTGNTWTYQVNDEGVMSGKITTIGDQELVAGTGPNKDVMAYKVVTQKGQMDQTVSWQAPVGDGVIRYREQSFSASTGALELEEHWDPHKLHIDGSARAPGDRSHLARDLQRDQAARRQSGREPRGARPLDDPVGV